MGATEDYQNFSEPKLGFNRQATLNVMYTSSIAQTMLKPIFFKFILLATYVKVF